MSNACEILLSCTPVSLYYLRDGIIILEMFLKFFLLVLNIGEMTYKYTSSSPCISIRLQIYLCDKM